MQSPSTKHVLLLAVLVSQVVSQDYEAEYEEDPNAIEGLPASAADLLDAPYDYGFNCDQQDAGYGYYADVNNACKVSTSASPSTTTRGPWTGWTSTASCAARAPSLTSPPSHATTQSLPSLARRVQAYMGRSSLARLQTTTEPMSWLCNQNRENKSDEKLFGNK